MMRQGSPRVHSYDPEKGRGAVPDELYGVARHRFDVALLGTAELNPRNWDEHAPRGGGPGVRPGESRATGQGRALVTDGGSMLDLALAGRRSDRRGDGGTGTGRGEGNERRGSDRDKGADSDEHSGGGPSVARECTEA